jgi:hypothetical protein
VAAVEFELDYPCHGGTFGAFVSGHDRRDEGGLAAGSKSRTGAPNGPEARCKLRGDRQTP